MYVEFETTSARKIFLLGSDTPALVRRRNVLQKERLKPCSNGAVLIADDTILVNYSSLPIKRRFSAAGNFAQSATDISAAVCWVNSAF